MPFKAWGTSKTGRLRNDFDLEGPPSTPDHRQVHRHALRTNAGFRGMSSPHSTGCKAHVLREDGQPRRKIHAHGEASFPRRHTLAWKHGCPALEEAATPKTSGDTFNRCVYKRGRGTFRPFDATTVEAASKNTIVSAVWRLAHDVKVDAKMALRKSSVVVTIRRLAARRKERDMLEDELLTLSQLGVQPDSKAAPIPCVHKATVLHMSMRAQGATYAGDALLHISLRAQAFKDFLHELSDLDLDGTAELEMIQNIKEIMSKLNTLKGLHSVGNNTVNTLSVKVDNLARELHQILLAVRSRIVVVISGLAAKSKIVSDRLQVFDRESVLLHPSSPDPTLANLVDVVEENEGNERGSNVSETMQTATEIMERVSDARVDPRRCLWRQAAILCDFETCVLRTFLQDIEDAVVDVLHAANACGHTKPHPQSCSAVSDPEGEAHMCSKGQILLEKVYGIALDAGQLMTEHHQLEHVPIDAWTGAYDSADDILDATTPHAKKSIFFSSQRAPVKIGTFKSAGTVTLSGRVATLIDTEQAPFLQDRLDVPFLWMPLVVPPKSNPSPSNTRSRRKCRASMQSHRQEAVSMTVEEVMVERGQRVVKWP